MTDLEKVELAAWQVKQEYGCQGTHEGDLIADAFEAFAQALASLCPKREDGDDD